MKKIMLAGLVSAAFALAGFLGSVASSSAATAPAVKYTIPCWRIPGLRLELFAHPSTTANGTEMTCTYAPYGPAYLAEFKVTAPDGQHAFFSAKVWH